jgi:2,5-diamino-6-(ribosylamino)-4(3H)-pyrimidinone 5'-phosphate reductase
MSESRPYIICHMAASVDGKIDGAALRTIMKPGEYEALHAKVGGNAWICGRQTMEEHFSEKEPFRSRSNAPAGPQPVHVARRADSYAISVDTLGKLNWSSGDLAGDHLICVVSERAPAEYVSMLRNKNISYVVAGESSVDLGKAVQLLGEHFGIRTLLLEGGGHINGAFLKAGLVDELSLLLLPGVDGRHDIAGVFDGIVEPNRTATPLKLKSVEQREAGALWIRYDVVRP